MKRRTLIALGVGVGAAFIGKALLRRSRFFSFEGKNVIITGGSRGLGLVLARRLLEAGARVTICARGDFELQRARNELEERSDQILAVRCDVRDRADVEKMVERSRRQWGPADVLINNAGEIEVGPFDAMTTDDFQRLMEIHCWGVLHTVRAVLPEMRQKGWGRIVNIASIGGKIAVPHLLPYTASKFALVGLSNGLRTELAQDGILVTTVCPGLMRTGSPRNAMFKGQNRKEHAWFAIGDSLPLLSSSAEKAADEILQAVQRGDGEVVVTMGGKLGAAAQWLAPGLVA